MNCNFYDLDKRIVEQIIQTTENAELVCKVVHNSILEMDVRADIYNAGIARFIHAG